MGAGTVTMPYIVTQLGLVCALCMIILGACLSYYTSMLLVKCSLVDNILLRNKTFKGDASDDLDSAFFSASASMSSYEDFAELAWGPKYRPLTATFTITSLLGFATAYISLAKTLIPTILGTTDL